MYKYKKKHNYIFIFILLIFLSIKLEFTKNFHNIITKNYDIRINNLYGICSPESVGYLKYLKKKYKFKSNPKIVNYEHVPQNNWVILNTKKINEKSEEIILLNYPGPIQKIKLERKKSNIYEFKDVEFYIDKFFKIKNIEIINKENTNDQNIGVEIFTLDKFLNKKIIKQINSIKVFNFSINLFFDEIDLNEKKLFFKFKNLKKNNEINISLTNKYILNQYKVLDSNENCHYVK